MKNIDDKKIVKYSKSTVLQVLRFLEGIIDEKRVGAEDVANSIYDLEDAIDDKVIIFPEGFEK